MIIPQADLELFARAAELSLEEAEQLLRDGEEVGFEPEFLSCLGLMAIRLVRDARRKIHSAAE